MRTVMFTLYGKIVRKNHIIRDMQVTDGSDVSRTAKVAHAVTAMSREFDLPEPIWLDRNIREFQRRSRTRFTQDNFIEAISFDFLEIAVLDE